MKPSLYNTSSLTGIVGKCDYSLGNMKSKQKTLNSGIFLKQTTKNINENISTNYDNKLTKFNITNKENT